MSITKKEYLQKLEDAYNKWNGSEEINKIIKIRGLFTPYSLFNKMLIYSQRPSSLICAGAKKWKEIGRNVFSNEYKNPIWIYAPIVKFVEEEKINSKGIKVTEKKKIVVGFNPVRIYDISQTDGVDIETINDKLAGNDAEEIFSSVIDKLSKEYCITSHTSDQSQKTVVIADNTMSILSGVSFNDKLYSIIYELSKMITSTDANDREIVARISSSLFMSDIGIDVSETEVKKIIVENHGNNFENLHKHITASTILVKKFEREFELNKKFSYA